MRSLRTAERMGFSKGRGHAGRNADKCGCFNWGGISVSPSLELCADAGKT